MTKIFLPTEIGVSGQGSHAGIRDEHTPPVHEIEPGENPAVKEQPEAYKRAYDVEKDGDGLTLAEQRLGVENTRNQVPWDAAPKDGDADPAREPVEVGELATGSPDTKAANAVTDAAANKSNANNAGSTTQADKK